MYKVSPLPIACNVTVTLWLKAKRLFICRTFPSSHINLITTEIIYCTEHIKLGLHAALCLIGLSITNHWKCQFHGCRHETDIHNHWMWIADYVCKRRYMDMEDWICCTNTQKDSTDRAEGQDIGFSRQSSHFCLCLLSTCEFMSARTLTQTHTWISVCLCTSWTIWRQIINTFIKNLGG